MKRHVWVHLGTRPGRWWGAHLCDATLGAPPVVTMFNVSTRAAADRHLTNYPLDMGAGDLLADERPANGTHDRIPAKAGWSNQCKQPCRQCGKETPKGRRTFCSDDCVVEWKIRVDPGFARAQVAKRDKGVCIACGFDCDGARDAMRRRPYLATYPPHPKWDGLQVTPEYLAAADKYEHDLHEWATSETDRISAHRTTLPDWARRLAFPTESWWQADHTVPVTEGGAGLGLANLRTLCIGCHQIATAELSARRAVLLQEARRIERMRVAAQPALFGGA